MDKKEVKYLSIRYLVLIILGLGNLLVFYFIFTPLTFYPVLWILNALYGAVISTGDTTITCGTIVAAKFLPSIFQRIACIDTTIIVKGYFASIIPACIAGSAYYLLTILNLTTPMPAKKRVNSLIFLLFSFLILNIIRTAVFAIIYVEKGYEFFSIAHLAAWYFGSTILVVLLWFAAVLIFKVKEVPIYSDLKLMYKRAKNKK